MDDRDTLVDKIARYKAAAERTTFNEMARSYWHLAAEAERDLEVLDKAVQAEIVRREAAAKGAAKAPPPAPQPSVIHKGKPVTKAELARALEQGVAEANRDRQRREWEHDAALTKAYGAQHPRIEPPPEVRRTRPVGAVAKSQRLRAEADRLDEMAHRTYGDLSQGYRQRATDVRKQAEQAEQETRKR